MPLANPRLRPHILYARASRKLGVIIMTVKTRIAPCLWFDNQAEDAARFYVSIFDESGVDGGIQELPTRVTPPGWMNYVQVADVKKAMAKAERLGAQVIVAYQPIPEMGAFGTFADPTGAVLGVWEPERKRARRASKMASRKKRASH
jgi:predicted enzyme related to lactoylglutathione lyase